MNRRHKNDKDIFGEIFGPIFNQLDQFDAIFNQLDAIIDPQGKPTDCGFNQPEVKKEAEVPRKDIYKSLVSHIADLPETPHFIVLSEENFNYDDGYGDRGESSVSTKNIFVLKKFETEEELTDWISENALATYGKVANFKVLQVNPVEFKVSTKIEVKRV